MVMMRYAPDHEGDVYRMYNPETKRIVESRDVNWAEWHGGQDVPEKMFAKDVEVDVVDNEILDEQPPLPTTENVPMPPVVVSDDEDDDAGAGRKERGTPAPFRAKATRVSHELARLRTSYNPASQEDISTSAASPQNPAGQKDVNSDHVSENENSESNDDENDDNGETTATGNDSVQVYYVYNATLASDPGEPKSLGEALQSSERLKWITGQRKRLKTF